MRVVAHPADLGGCGHYRMIYPAEALAAEGRDVRIAYDHTYPVARFPTLDGHQVLGVVGDKKAANRLVSAMQGELALARRRGATQPEQERIAARYAAELRADCEQAGHQTIDADVVVMQRILSEERFDTMVALQASGAAVVVEIDDDFHAIHRRNPAWRAANPLNDPGIHRDWLMRACARADLVTVTTPALAQRYAPHGRVRILPNYVPAWYLDVPGPDDRLDCVTVGWSGSTLTHPDDLEQTGTAIPEVLRATGAALQIVGTGKGVAKALSWDGDVHGTDWVEIDQYPAAMRRIDVGIVPLARNQFNEAKSSLKGIEFASVGVPFVATPTGPYRELAHDRVGLLADTPAEWYGQVLRLTRDRNLRADLGAVYRQAVADRYTIERNAWKWWDAWTAARTFSEHRKGL